ncbi:hypothetical protein R1sor_010215 [Riccia sorocarpa]|uniref:tripeptidyl-peptidase II n=1 Tax=Riccia sorocarpa TaxID=122646 RepID=A0ABD3I3F6_9MARC
MQSSPCCRNSPLAHHIPCHNLQFTWRTWSGHAQQPGYGARRSVSPIFSITSCERTNHNVFGGFSTGDGTLIALNALRNRNDGQFAPTVGHSYRRRLLKRSKFGGQLQSSSVRGATGKKNRTLSSDTRGQKCTGTPGRDQVSEMVGFELDKIEDSTDEEPNLDIKCDSAEFLGGLMPKKEVGADSFLKKFPLYDGRGVTIAIFDSGVDPAAAGLETTSDGKPKIIDVVDCTGSGDINTSTIAKADADGYITGASGARLQINKSWKNPSGDWHVGCKFAFGLFTDTLVTRIKKERKKKWSEEQREAITEAMRQLTAFNAKYPKVSDAKLKKEREDLQTKYDLLQKVSDSYEDKGPIIDAVVWHDGDVWRAALDTQEMEGDTELGKLIDFIPMTNYRIERKYGIFSRMDACTFVTNIYDDGNILSIVTDSSPHGTHVAGITAAHHPKEPLLNGVAPGAQLVSCKIGDSRLGSMETGTGLTRGLIAVIENKCDLINMSYGEPTMMPDYGRFIDLATEVVNKYGVIFISSAGNNGPSLSTVTAPGGTSSSIIGIGAYVSPSMAAAAHSVVEPPEHGLQYTWSSRGPTPDGDLGVSLSAPGGAVAPVPKWTLQKRMLMNGTSMASPCACGSVALVLSALKAEEQAISPHIVRKALENTALKVSDSQVEPLTTGRGLIQVDKAYEYLQKCKDRPSVLYKVHLTRLGTTGPNLRGVYLREFQDLLQASEWTISVKPQFHEDADNLKVVAPFEERLQLESTDASWLKCPEYLLLTNNGRTFNIVVDPTNLGEGVHYGEVRGTDLEASWRGPSFRIPVTVIKPIQVSASSPKVTFSDLSFVPGFTDRRFILVPEGATWAEVTIRCHGFDTPRRFIVSAVQLLPKKRPSVWDTYATFSSPSSKDFAFAVEGGVTMELTLALFWSSGNGSHVPALAEIEVEFHGLLSDERELSVNGGEIVTRVDIKAPLAAEKLAPSATLTSVRVPYRPVEAKVEPLSASRDKLSNGRQIHGLTLKYKFSLGEAAEVTPRLSYLNDRIYDTEFESQFYMIFDVNKRVLASGDCYPKNVKLPKGDYLLRMLVRHDNVNYLEKLKKSPLLLDRKLEEKNYVKLNFFSHIDGAVTGSDQVKGKSLAPGEIYPLYLGSASDDKLPKDSPLGSILIGTLRWGKLSKGSSKSESNGEDCPACSQISYVLPPQSKAEEKGKEKPSTEAKKTVAQTLEDEIRDAKIKVLSSLPISTKEERKDWDDLVSVLKTDYPKHLQLRVEILQKLAASQEKDDKLKVIHAADEVVSLIDRDALAKYFGIKTEAEDPEAAVQPDSDLRKTMMQQVRKEMENQRDALADALYKKGLALLDIEEQVTSKETTIQPKAEETTPAAAESVEKSAEDDNGAGAETPDRSSPRDEKVDEFEEDFKELRKWVDVASPKYSLLSVKREKRAGRLGTAIKALNDLIQDDSKPPQKHLFELRIQLIEKIGWAHWAAYERKWLKVRFPSDYPLF